MSFRLVLKSVTLHDLERRNGSYFATPYLQVVKGHVNYFSNFGTPSISPERLELETSNLACRLITRGTNEKNAKLGHRGREGVT